MAILSNYTSYRTVTGTSYADSIYNLGNHVTINAAAGNDTIKNLGDTVKVNGDAGNDIVSLNSSGHHNVIKYYSGEGNDIIYNLGATDTISIVSGQYTRSTVGNDVVLTVGNGKVTLVGAKGKTVNIKGTQASEIQVGNLLAINNTIDNRTLTGTSYADSIYNLGNHVTINAAAGNDTIKNLGDTVKVNGGAGNDFIYSYSYYGTIDGDAGNDIVSLNSSGHHNVIKYYSGEGNDIIYNLGATDTISIVSGQYTRSTVGNDVVLTVGNGKVTLVGAKGKTVNIKGTQASEIQVGNLLAITTIAAGNYGVTLNNSQVSKRLSGTSYIDSIKNSGNYATISSYAGNDKIYNEYGNSTFIVAGAGNDSIFNRSYYSTINGEDGNDTISNFNGAQASINGGAGNDLISLGGDLAYAMTDVTVKGGTGNDTIYGDEVAQTFQYANGDGNDKIFNWSSNDTLSITSGQYTRSTVGNDVVLTVGNGKVTLVGAKGKTVNIKGTQASEIQVGNLLAINNTIDNRTLTGTSYADSIYNLGNHVTINAAAGNDTIKNIGDTVKVNGGAGNDFIYSYSYYGTIDGDAGNDIVSLNSSGHHNVIKYYSGEGNDIIYNLGATDTISIVSGQYTRSTVGNDVVLTVGNGKVTLVGAKGKTVNIKGTQAVTVTPTVQPATTSSGNDIYGTNGHDNIENTVANKIVYAYAGNDTVRNKYANNVVIYGGDGSDSISSFQSNNVFISSGAGHDRVSVNGSAATLSGDAGDDIINAIYGSNFSVEGGDGNDDIKVSGRSSTVRGGNGNDNINHSGANSSVFGGTGNDNITANSESIFVCGDTGSDFIKVEYNSNGSVSGGDGDDTIRAFNGTNLTLNGGTGNDQISLSSGASCVIQYASGDGYDTVVGFNDNDTLRITGSYSRSTVGNDLVVRVGSGSITFKNVKGKSININGLATSYDLATSADLASDWITTDDKNFITNDANLNSIMNDGSTNYSSGKFTSAYDLTSLTQKNTFVTFGSKK